jgi:hypothetical protein
MKQHAILSPSGAERWLSCTPSARLELKFPDKSSEFAREGTLAHSLGELLIKHRTNAISKQKFELEFSRIKADDLYNDSMLDYCDEYATFVMEAYSEALSHTSDAQLFLEQQLNLTDYVPEGFGTGDVVIIADGILTLIDLKYGKGVQVSAENNKQMMLYSLGALREFDFIFSIDTIRMTIYQPRIGNYSTWDIAVKDLRLWAKETLIPLAEMAFKGQGEYVPGKHCQFCKAKGVCKAIADYNMELATYDFQVSALLEDQQVSDILSRAKLFIDWIEAVQDHALNEAVTNGKKWPGFKVVEGRSNRKYADKDKVAQKLIESGFSEEVIYEKNLLGITAMQTAISKKIFEAELSNLIVKPPGKPTLVPESDKRPEYNSTEKAASDFAIN